MNFHAVLTGVIATLALSAGLLSVNVSQAAEPRKFALIAADWGDAKFAAGARKMANELSRAGWQVYVLDGSVPVSGGSQFEAYVNLLKGVVAPGDQVLLDIQGFGAEGRGYFTTGNKTGSGEDEYGYEYYNNTLLRDSFATTLKYPYADRIMFDDHWVSVHIPGTPLHDLGENEMVRFSSAMHGLGVKTTVIDHSSYGGSTVRRLELEPSADPNLCVISTTAVLTPGLGAEPSTGDYLERLNNKGTIHHKNMNHLADFISRSFYKSRHSKGNQFQSIGYRTGCTDTMALRDVLSLSASAWGLSNDWNRQASSHVVRSPARYATLEGASPDQPYAGPGANPRLAIARGWSRWYNETVNKFYVDHAFASYAATAYSSYYTVPTNVPTIYSNGLALGSALASQKARVDALESVLSQSRSWYGSPSMTADQYLRDTLIKTCLCPVRDRAPVNRYTLNCEGPVYLPPAAKKFNPGAICSDPDSLVGLVAKDAPGLAAAVAGLKDASDAAKQSSVALSSQLQAFEATCNSSSCGGQGL